MTNRKRAEPHGMTGTPEYEAWASMRRRCRVYHRKRRIYAERGITVCPEWDSSFQAFFSHVGLRPSPQHSLDRIRNDEGYAPGNVRWATAEEQNRNRRISRMVTLQGETRNLIEWSELSGLRPDTIAWRMDHGWPEDAILTIEPDKHNRLEDGHVVR